MGATRPYTSVVQQHESTFPCRSLGLAERVVSAELLYAGIPKTALPSTSPTVPSQPLVSFRNIRFNDYGLVWEVFNHSELSAQLAAIPYQVVYNDGGWNQMVISGMAIVQTSNGTIPAGDVREVEDSFSSSDRVELSR